MPRPDRPSYTIAMLAATRYGDAAELIAQDPGLLDVEVWRLFEVEGGGEDSLANHEKFFGDRWGDVFRDLAAGDPAMRERLLDVSLAALGRDFATLPSRLVLPLPRVTGTDRRGARPAHRRLPGAPPKPRRPDGFVGGRRARQGSTAPGACRRTTCSTGSGRSSSRRRRARRRRAWASSGAPVPRSPDDARRAAIVATDALAHPSPDVQRAAIVLIGEARRRARRRGRAGDRRTACRRSRRRNGRPRPRLSARLGGG